VHHTGIAGGGFESLPEGAKVSYDATQGPKGPERLEHPDDLTPVDYPQFGNGPSRREVSRQTPEIDDHRPGPQVRCLSVSDA
jgi:hypothetical protein